MRRRKIVLWVLLCFVFAVAGCGSGGGSTNTTSDQSNNSSLNVTLTPPANLLSDPVEVAAALSKADTVNLGIWSLLSNLGIGVYTPEGDVVMQGAEKTVDDFWLYDVQVPLLAEAAFSEPTKFSKFHNMVTSLFNIDITSTELLGVYKDTYSNNGDYFLSKLFNSMGVVFEGDPEITGLQGILLFLDGFVQPNSSATAAKATMRSGVKRTLGSQAKYNICIAGDMVGNTGINYVLGQALGLLLERVGLGAIDSITAPFDAFDAMLIGLDIHRNLSLDNRATHVKSCEKYPSPIITATASINIKADSDIGQQIASCGRRAGMRLRGYGGTQSIPSVPVNWIVSGDGATLVDYSIDSGAQTDMLGQSKLSFTPKTTNRCEGSERHSTVEVEAEFATAAILAALGGDIPVAFAAIFHQVVNNSVFETSRTFDVAYHEGSPKIESVTPVNGTINVPVDSKVTVKFSTDMDTKTITPQTLSVGDIPGNINFPDSKTAVFTPETQLDYGKTYDVIVTTGVMDTSGTPLESSYSWSFITVGDTITVSINGAAPVTCYDPIGGFATTGSWGAVHPTYSSAVYLNFDPFLDTACPFTESDFWILDYSIPKTYDTRGSSATMFYDDDGNETTYYYSYLDSIYGSTYSGSTTITEFGGIGGRIKGNFNFELWYTIDGEFDDEWNAPSAMTISGTFDVERIPFPTGPAKASLRGKATRRK